MLSCTLQTTVVNGERMKAWQTVYSFFRRAKETGLWDKILQHLVKVTRRRAGRNPNPTYAIIDSQSVDTAYKSEQVGYVMTDTMGNLVHRFTRH